MRRATRWVYVGISLLLEGGEETYRVIAAACRAAGAGTDRSYTVPWLPKVGPEIGALIDQADAWVFDLSSDAPSVHAEWARAEEAAHRRDAAPGRILLIARDGTHIRAGALESRVTFYRSREHLEELLQRWLRSAPRKATRRMEPPFIRPTADSPALQPGVPARRLHVEFAHVARPAPRDHQRRSHPGGA